MIGTSLRLLLAVFLVTLAKEVADAARQNVNVKDHHTAIQYNPCQGAEFYPDPDDCTKFYHCNGDIPYHMDCPASLEWDVKVNRCEYPSVAQCSSGNGTEPGTETPTTEGPEVLPTDCPYNPCNGNPFYPDPNDCTKYYSCDGTSVEHWTCPEGTEWDAVNNTCQPPDVAQCSITGTTTQSPTEITTSVTDESSGSESTFEPSTTTSEGSGSEPLTELPTSESSGSEGTTEPSTETTSDEGSGSEETTEPFTETTTDEGSGSGETTEPFTETTTDESSGSGETTEPFTETTTDEGSGSGETTEPFTETTTDEGSGSGETTEPFTETTTDEGSGSGETTEPFTETTTDEGSGSGETTEPFTETTTDEGSGSGETTEPFTETTTDEGSGSGETTEPFTETTTDQGSGSGETTEPFTDATTSEGSGCTDTTVPITGTTPAISSTTNVSPTSSPLPYPCNPCKGGEFYAFPDDCTKYYRCQGIYPYLKDCPEGLEWNNKLLICDWPEFANCTSYGSPTAV